jgi:hypothetical protein
MKLGDQDEHTLASRTRAWPPTNRRLSISSPASATACALGAINDAHTLPVSQPSAAPLRNRALGLGSRHPRGRIAVAPTRASTGTDVGIGLPRPDTSRAGGRRAASREGMRHPYIPGVQHPPHDSSSFSCAPSPKPHPPCTAMVLAIRVEMHPSPTDIRQSSQAAVRSRQRTPYRAIDRLAADLRCRTTFLFLGQRSEPTSPSSTWLTSSVIQCSAAKCTSCCSRRQEMYGNEARVRQGGGSTRSTTAGARAATSRVASQPRPRASDMCAPRLFKRDVCVRGPHLHCIRR